jgi:hypothetical protein
MTDMDILNQMIKDSALHNTPENAMRIDGPNYLKFNHLAGLGR